MPVFETLIPLVLLQNVKGVSTVWVWDGNGSLFFGSVEGEIIGDPASADESWQQIDSLLKTQPLATPDRQELALDFEGQLLFARREEDILLAVMAEPHVNRHAVRLGSNLFYHKLRLGGKDLARKKAAGSQG